MSVPVCFPRCKESLYYLFVGLIVPCHEALANNSEILAGIVQRVFQSRICHDGKVLMQYGVLCRETGVLQTSGVLTKDGVQAAAG